jgi:hypothetical protein
MAQKLEDVLRPSSDPGLARSFSRLGWAGFWLQVLFGSLPILVLGYYFMYSRSAAVSRSGVPFVEYITIANLVMLVVTALWSYRYTRLGRRLLDAERRPTEAAVCRSVWTGVVLSTVGMLLSMIVILIEAGNLLFLFLKAPQGGIPVIQTSGGDSPYWVSAVDMVSLIALILTLFAELLVLVFSLWLLSRVTRSYEVPEATDGRVPVT